VLAEPRPIIARLRDAWRAYATVKPDLREVSRADPYYLYGGAPTPYNPSELISTKGYIVIDQMRRDDQVKAALAFKKQSVLATGWQVKVPEGQPTDWEPKVELERMLWGVQGGLNRALKEILSALDYGFSCTEKVWHEVDGKVRVKKLAVRKPHDVTLGTDPAGNLTKIEQRGKELPLEKMILYTYDYEFSNYYGRSDLEAAHRAWWTKKNAYQWMSMLLERLGIPPIYALYDHNAYTPAQQAKLIEILESLQAASVGAIPRSDPKDLEMWAPELAGQVSSVFVPALQMLNQDISRALLMPGLIGMTSDATTGSLARSQVHFDVFLLVLEAIRSDLQDLVNEQIIDDALLFNFGEMGDDEKPYFEFMPLSDDVRLDILEKWGALVDGKVVTPTDADESHIRTSVKFPEFDEQDAKQRAERRRKNMPAPLEGAPPQNGTPPPNGEDKNGDEPLSNEQFERLMAEVATWR